MKIVRVRDGAALDRRTLDRAFDGAQGARWFFGELAEPICDSFEPALQHRHEELLRAVIAEAGRRDAVFRAAFDRRLPLGLAPDGPAPVRRATPPDLCLVPSRVTIGADIAITSVLLDAVRTAWPDTRVVLLGAAAALRLLSHGREGVEIWDHPYPRHGSLLERLTVWTEIADAVADWERSHPGASMLVLDPDSRVTQSGLLPLASKEATRLFPGRYAAREDRRALSELAASWAGAVTGRAAARAGVIPPADALDWADAVTAALRARYGRPVVIGSLGVGGNPAKAAGPRAEAAILAAISARATVVLDSGSGPDEARRAVEAARGWARLTGGSLCELPAGTSPAQPDRGRPVLYLLHGADLGRAAGLLARADLLVGYDSALPHLAGAVGTPGVALFVEPPSPTFVDRWRAPLSTPLACAGGAGPEIAPAVAEAVIEALDPARRTSPERWRSPDRCPLR